MSPEGRNLLASILKRDQTLSETERAHLRFLMGETMIAKPPGKTGYVLPAPESLRTRAEVADILNVSVATILRLEESAELRPLFITGDCPRYVPAEVAAFITKRRLIRDASDATVPGGIAGRTPPAESAALFPKERFLTRGELAERLRVSLSTVLRLDGSAELRPLFITEDCPRYDPSEVSAFICDRCAKRKGGGVAAIGVIGAAA